MDADTDADRSILAITLCCGQPVIFKLGLLKDSLEGQATRGQFHER